MSEKKISYLSRTYEDYKNSLIELTKKYYPEISDSLTDASIGSWLIDIMSVVGDNLSYYIDKAYNETNLDSATKASSIYALARSNGFKIPGPKGSITELEFSCILPPSTNVPNSSSSMGMPSFAFAPIIKKGTRVKSNNGQYFETDEDVDFSEHFDKNGNANRNIIPIINSNNQIKSYKVTKTVTATAGISKIYKQSITAAQTVPFMEFIIPETNVMNVESIIFKDGGNFQSYPSIDEFYNENEFVSACDSVGGTDTYRFFEVNSLIDQYVWGDDKTDGTSKTYKFGFYNPTSGQDIPTYSVTKGKWNPITQKFITEFTDGGYLKVIFGSGEQIGQDVDVTAAKDFSKYQISRMVRNNFLGVLPKDGTTMYIMYRVGGGKASNVAAGTINTITYLNAINKTTPSTANDKTIAANIIASITVTNTIPSVSGKDAPNEDEIKAMIKYYNGAQERCVTVKDYESRVQMMPARYGCPFKVSAIEENNKIMIYLLLCNYLGQLSDAMPSEMITNIMNYLSKYRTINDFVEIKTGKIINLSFEVDAYINKNYNTGDVVNSIISTVKDYMDVNKHQLGEDIYVSDIEKEISNIDGVINLIDLRIYNETGNGYSKDMISQQIVNYGDNGDYDYVPDGDRSEIDLEASDYILNSNADEMFEIKYPDNDIRVRVKVR